MHRKGWGGRSERGQWAYAVAAVLIGILLVLFATIFQAYMGSVGL